MMHRIVRNNAPQCGKKKGREKRLAASKSGVKPKAM